MKKKIFVLLALLGLILFLFVLDFNHFSLQDIKTYILSFKALAPLVFILMFTFVPLTFFPDAILAVAGGTIFGVWQGSLYIMIGALMGGTLSFYISRYFGREFVEKLIGHKAKGLEAGVEKSGFLFILMLRLIPLIPFDMISYGAGLSKIRYTDFLAGTLIGIIPGVLIYANIGDKALNIHSVEFYLSIGLLMSLLAVSYWLKKKFTLKHIQKIVSKEI